MMSTRTSSAVGLALLATACGLSAGCQGSATTAQPQYAPGYGPYPPGYAPPGYAPGYAPPGGYAPAAANAPRPGYAAGPQPGYAQGAVPQQVAPGSSTFAGALNMSALQSIASRNPKACGLLQVAPGVYARIDCQAYAPSQRAVAHLSPRKALALQHHTTQWQPLQFFGARFQQAMAQGFSKGIFQRPVNGVNGTQQGVAGAAGAPVVTADPVPGTVDHRTQNLEGPIKDQGPVGACTAFSLSATIDNAAIRAGKMQAGVGSQASSPNHVWSGYGFPQMGAAADANLGRAIAPMSLWGQSHSESCKIANPIIGDCGSAVSPPVVAGTFRQDPLLVAKSDRADQGGIYRVGAYEKLDTQPAKIEQIVQILASGADLWIAMKIDGFAWSNSKMKGGVIPDWQQENGGHAVTMAGYRETANGKQFLVHNNWGTSWGDGGYGWVSEAMIQKWMHFAYQVKLTDAPKAGEVADDDCGSDQMVDVVKGICGLICPDNSRPANGCVPLQPGQLPQIPGLAPGQLPQIPGFPPFGR